VTFGREQFDHPSYSPDLVPSDFHVFLHLKTFLGGRQFHDDSEVKEAINMWFALQAASFYDAGIQKLVTATTSASTMVEIMSKSSAWYVH
jgi:histone-lysine N-methyltransferase SETMAR